jgi:serine/threonine protein kinase
MAIHTGQQLGNYRFVRHLGHGGFAEVYLGEHIYLKSYAALKILHTTLKEEEVERFLSEAQTLVGLRHPNIVRVLEFLFEGGTPALVMDYALGGSARQHFPGGSRLPLAATVASIKQVAAALQYAHDHSIIHRDVKPENILFDSDQQILLSDFGLALLAPSPELLSTQEWAGTLAYMAPEQLQGKPTFASDQYALGIVTYEWLCGMRPFEGDRWGLMHQHVFVPPPPFREKCPELPVAVENVVLKALSKNPKDRYVSVQLFAQALERASLEDVVTLEDDTQPLVALKMTLPPPAVTITTPNRPGPHAPHQIFLTAAPADEPLAARLRMDLEARGVVFYSVKENSTFDQDALRQAVRDAQMMLVVVSPSTRSSRTVKEHLRIAGMYQQRMVFVWAAGDTIAAILPEAWGRTALIDLVDARGNHYMAALDEIMAFYKQETLAVSPEEFTLPAPPGEPRNPFKGLRAFAKGDAADFFGRDTLILELAETIEGILAVEKPTTPGSRLLTVIGPSGSGKSSAVMAGLLPEMQRSALPGSEAWVYLGQSYQENVPSSRWCVQSTRTYPTGAFAPFVRIWRTTRPAVFI